MSISKVEISTGKLAGIFERNVHAFKGIPYGGPTGGQNRFKPPTPTEPWTGIKDATHYGQSCWQPPDVTPMTFQIAGSSGIDQMGEDCLVLNVWTPGLNDGVKRPVMVWLHGGGFSVGSGDHSPYFDGASLSGTGDVVVVSVNHRLGIFGYLYLEELAGDQYAGSGNAGMLDIVQALKWIKVNISIFGGDPGNVTIFGESVGGTKVTTLLAMPEAKGFFHRAISQSSPGTKARNPEEATQAAREFLNTFGIRPSQVNLLHEMRTDMIYSGWTAMRPSGAMPMSQFGPVVDGKSLPTNPFEPTSPPPAADIPLMSGNVRDEMTIIMMRQPELRTCNEAVMRDKVMARFNDKTGKLTVPQERIDNLIATYHRTRPDATPYDILLAISSDRMRMGAIQVAERKIAGGDAPVYMYLFTWESPFGGGILKSCHTLELPFVFNNVESEIGMLGHGPERFKMAAVMSAAWVAFARNGDPNHKGLPHWPAYTTVKRSTMIFNTESKMVDDPFSDERRAWEGMI